MGRISGSARNPKVCGSTPRQECAKKGVFITTGAFSADGIDHVEKIDPKVVLIDGSRLAELMIDL
jgi:restriction system protein